MSLYVNISIKIKIFLKNFQIQFQYLLIIFRSDQICCFSSSSSFLRHPLHHFINFFPAGIWSAPSLIKIHPSRNRNVYKSISMSFKYSSVVESTRSSTSVTERGSVPHPTSGVSIILKTNVLQTDGTHREKEIKVKVYSRALVFIKRRDLYYKDK